MNAKDRDKDIVCESERCRGGRMRGEDKHDAKNTSPPYEFSVYWHRRCVLKESCELVIVISLFSVFCVQRIQCTPREEGGFSELLATGKEQKCTIDPLRAN